MDSALITTLTSLNIIKPKNKLKALFQRKNMSKRKLNKIRKKMERELLPYIVTKVRASADGDYIDGFNTDDIDYYLANNMDYTQTTTSSSSKACDVGTGEANCPETEDDAEETDPNDVSDSDNCYYYSEDSDKTASELLKENGDNSLESSMVWKVCKGSGKCTGSDDEDGLKVACEYEKENTDSTTPNLGNIVDSFMSGVSGATECVVTENSWGLQWYQWGFDSSNQSATCPQVNAVLNAYVTMINTAITTVRSTINCSENYAESEVSYVFSQQQTVGNVSGGSYIGQTMELLTNVNLGVELKQDSSAFLDLATATSSLQSAISDLSTDSSKTTSGNSGNTNVAGQSNVTATVQYNTTSTNICTIQEQLNLSFNTVRSEITSETNQIQNVGDVSGSTVEQTLKIETIVATIISAQISTALETVISNIQDSKQESDTTSGITSTLLEYGGYIVGGVIAVIVIAAAIVSIKVLVSKEKTKQKLLENQELDKEQINFALKSAFK